MAVDELEEGIEFSVAGTRKLKGQMWICSAVFLGKLSLLQQHGKVQRLPAVKSRAGGRGIEFTVAGTRKRRGGGRV